jgi:hypothetical protein
MLLPKCLMHNGPYDLAKVDMKVIFELQLDYYTL